MNPGFTFLKNKGISKQTIKDFYITYLENNRLYGAGLDFSQKLINIIKPFIARFNHCLLIPIFDLYNNLVSVYARRLEGTPKFDCIPFLKSQIVFGLNKTCIATLQKKYIFLTEGVFDFLVAYQNGLNNVGSLLGCCLSFNQLTLCLRFTDSFIVVFDSDNPGREGMRRASDLISKHGGKYSLVYLPSGKDLDDFILENGIQKLLTYAKNFTKV